MMLSVVYLASFTSSQSAENLACGLESLLWAFLGGMQDFQHKLHNFVF